MNTRDKYAANGLSAHRQRVMARTTPNQAAAARERQAKLDLVIQRLRKPAPGEDDTVGWWWRPNGYARGSKSHQVQLNAWLKQHLNAMRVQATKLGASDHALDAFVSFPITYTSRGAGG